PLHEAVLAVRVRVAAYADAIAARIAAVGADSRDIGILRLLRKRARPSAASDEDADPKRRRILHAAVWPRFAPAIVISPQCSTTPAGRMTRQPREFIHRLGKAASVRPMMTGTRSRQFRIFAALVAMGALGGSASCDADETVNPLRSGGSG